MKNKELFDKTISILVKAYMNDTLKHGECAYCVVGNLIHAGGYNFDYDPFGENDTQWLRYLENTFKKTGNGWKHSNLNPIIAIEQLSYVGYSHKDLFRIEKAFERCGISKDEDQHMLNGLMAVVNLLQEIHEVEEEEIKTAKLLFVK
jgi:hypothetical protein